MAIFNSYVSLPEGNGFIMFMLTSAAITLKPHIASELSNTLCSGEICLRKWGLNQQQIGL